MLVHQTTKIYLNNIFLVKITLKTVTNVLKYRVFKTTKCEKKKQSQNGYHNCDINMIRFHEFVGKSL